MSNYLSSTFGRIIGRHGTAVGSLRDGKPVLKVFTSPANPKSAKQKAQRTKFALVLICLKPLRKIIYKGFGGKKDFYEAFSWAMKNAVTGVSPDFTIDYSKVKVASGLLAKAFSTHISIVAGNVITVQWGTEFWGEGSQDDIAQVVFLDPAFGGAKDFDTGATRQDGEYTVTLTGLPAGALLHVWLFFTSGELRSDSQYIGNVQII